MAREYGVSTLACDPLAGGLLTGKHRRDFIPEGGRFDRNRMYQDRVLKRTHFPCRRPIEEDRRTCRSLPDQPCLRVAPASHRERCRHARSFVAAATQADSEGLHGRSITRRCRVCLGSGMARIPRACPELQPMIVGAPQGFSRDSCLLTDSLTENVLNAAISDKEDTNGAVIFDSNQLAIGSSRITNYSYWWGKSLRRCYRFSTEPAEHSMLHGPYCGDAAAGLQGRMWAEFRPAGPGS